MTYEHRVFRAEDLLSYLQAKTALAHEDSYVSEDGMVRAYEAAISEGFGWVGCEHGYAIFERTIISSERDAEATSSCEGCGAVDPPIYFCMCGSERCRACVEPGPEKHTWTCPECAPYATDDSPGMT